MSERLARSEEEVEHSRSGLTRKNEELEERRRLMETVFETVASLTYVYLWFGTWPPLLVVAGAASLIGGVLLGIAWLRRT